MKLYIRSPLAPPIPFTPLSAVPTRSHLFVHLFDEQLKLQLDEINQNPFRQGLLKGREESEAGSGRNSEDIAEDMNWGFDQSFFQKEGDGDDDEDYDDI